MPKCVYCGKMYHDSKGLSLVMNDGNIAYLCSSKCRKNLQMGRDKKKLPWIKKGKKTRAEEIAEIKQETQEEEQTERLQEQAEETKISDEKK